MDYISINRLITKSVYKQIADSITAAIKDGTLRFNDKLPTEKEICQMFSISQTAVKMAYEKLINEGMVKRIKGKGTFVTNRDVYSTKLHSFFGIEILPKNSDIVNKTVVLLDRSNRDRSSLRELKLSSSDKYINIVNLYKTDENPKLLQKIYLPDNEFQSFDENYNHNMDIYSNLEITFEHTIKYMHSSINPINASKSDALLLNIEQDDAIYLIRSKIVNDKDEVIAYVCNYYPGEFTEFEVTVNAE